MKKLIYTLLFFVGWNSAANAGTFVEYHSIYCGSILELGPVGYPSWITATLIKAPQHGQVFVFDTPPFPDSLVYKSDYGYLGQDTFIVECAHATQITCDTGIYIISVTGCPPIQAFTEIHTITCDSILLIPNLGYPTWVTPEIIQPPTHGTASLVLDSSLWHTLQYLPMQDLTGTDTIVVECAHATQVTCETGIYIIHVQCLDAARELMEQPALQVFPNPVTNRVVVEATQPIERIRLLNMQGKVLLDESFYPATTRGELFVGDVPPGVMLVETWLSGQKVVKKLAISR